MPEHPASRALRAGSPELLHELLVSHIRDHEDGWLRDVRDLMWTLAPFHDCARRLGLDVSAVFRAAADAGPESLREVVTTFGARRDVTEDAFWFDLVEGPDGPAYRFRH